MKVVKVVALYIYAWSKHLVFLMGFMFLTVLVAYGIHALPFTMSTVSEESISRLTTTDTRYWLIAAFVVYVVGMVVSMGNEVYKFIKKRKEKKVIPSKTDDRHPLLKVAGWIISH